MKERVNEIVVNHPTICAFCVYVAWIPYHEKMISCETKATTQPTATFTIASIKLAVFDWPCFSTRARWHIAQTPSTMLHGKGCKNARADLLGTLGETREAS